MSAAKDVLDEFGVTSDVQVLSAHRTPDAMIEWGKAARDNGFSVVIAGAGGAAHLPGMLASVTTLPVIGVPVSLDALDGMDSLLSIVQMPAGIPVATVGIGNAKNAALLALRMLAITDSVLAKKLDAYAVDLADMVAAKNTALKDSLS
jgi:5-(carboxyamino)imidazole ribonucleotide mutase